MNITGTVLEFKSQLNEDDQPNIKLIVEHELGRGSQGIVYSAKYPNGSSVALKVYPEDCLAKDPHLEERIKELIYIGSPHEFFLWPIEFIETEQNRISIKGYTMPIRDTRFISATSLLEGNLDIDFRVLIELCQNLVEAFYQLHIKGLCYKDISFGNFFFDPSNGSCVICDLDNICYSGQGGGVLGTPGFMAPEIVKGEVCPSSATDLHSLAVLIFYILYIHHPLEGKNEAQVKIMDDVARREIYGTNAKYIFHPADESNRPDPSVHQNALVMHKILPNSIKRVFQTAFVDALHFPNLRVVESQWKLVLDEVLDNLGHCYHCGQEVFLDEFKSSSQFQCWACHSHQSSLIIQINEKEVLVSPGKSVLDDDGKIIGNIVRHPSKPNVLGLQNMTSNEWSVIKPNGESITIPSSKSVVLGRDLKILNNTQSILVI